MSLVRGYAKSTSILWMQALGVPVLSGLILFDWDLNASSAVQGFGNDKHVSEFLLRIDKQGQRWTDRRGGYLISLGEVQTTVWELRQLGMLTLLLEPVSPLSDQFSFGILADVPGRKTSIEVVGPGFDASDIVRGDLLAHERWEVVGDLTSPNAPLQTMRTYAIDQRAFVQSIEARLAKIGARIQNPALPDTSYRDDAEKASRFVSLAKQYLSKTRQDVLLNASGPVFVPIVLIEQVMRNVQKTIRALLQKGVELSLVSFSASVTHAGLIFWDFFPAKPAEVGLL